LAGRLAEIHEGLTAVVAEYGAQLGAVERVFVATNPRSALVLGQARGAALAALGSAGLEVTELSAREVKKAVSGTGSAGKAQVQSMVMRLLALSALPPMDAADALAVAICQAHRGRHAAGVHGGRRRSLRSLVVDARVSGSSR
jgi:crossover junction endodeoxyribonuclease RuvC